MMLHDSLPTLGWLDIHVQWNVSLTLEWNLKPIFAKCLAQHGVTARLTTVKNPQANAICKHLHQAIGNSLRTMQI